MTTRKIEKGAMQAYFEKLSSIIAGKSVEIEVNSLAVGAQVEADWAKLVSIVYDPRDDAVEVTLEGLGHAIRNPTEAYVIEDEGGVKTVEVTDSGGAKHIVNLREPLLLSA